jgi:PPK2 family polyphosphate:nucleotide phosphotransferase
VAVPGPAPASLAKTVPDFTENRHVFEAPRSPFLVGLDGRFAIDRAATGPPDGAPGKKECVARLEAAAARLAELQPILHAHDRHAVLFVFQALDAAGKDGTIRAVLQGVNPAGCRVHSFKAPTAEELDHDFLWRTTRLLPERGMIVVFNRSYYEEVLVVRVHPEFLAAQNLPDHPDDSTFWEDRFRSIREHEAHLARNGTVIVKFFLHVSAEEQRRRFLSRIDDPHKNWKFSEKDVAERAHRKEYVRAFEEALNATSRPYAPWYAIPADDKPFLRMTVAELMAATLTRLELRYPEIAESDRKRFAKMRKLLEAETPA